MENYNKELCEERHIRIEDRLTKHGQQIDSLEKCVIKLTEMIERHDNECKDSDKRLSAIETKPMATIGKVCGYAATAIFGALSGWILKYFELIG
ncbi:MAG: hypothetical protein E7667_02515 [Ruminococcaceae bacterium]|nr:hypothetical protein [Oscillospiraceae bacterium]